MSEQLFTCPRCERHGFTGKGLVAHVCRGMKTGDVRRRLTDDERAEACAAAVRQLSQANPDNPELLRAEKPFGYDVEVEWGNPPRFDWFHWRGSEATVRRKAVMKSLFRRVTEIKPLTREQWVRAYGLGRM